LLQGRAQWNEGRSYLSLYKKLADEGEVYVGMVTPSLIEPDADLDELIAMANAAEDARVTVRTNERNQ
jgi:hypothetical protein